MADILEERSEEAQDEDLQFEEEGTQEQPDTSNLPEKYQGKSIEELVRMHQEAEQLIGRHSSEVGELRRVVDSYIQAQLSDNKAPESDEEEVDFFSDPEKAVAKAIESHPKVQQAERTAQEYTKQQALEQLQRKHPDMNEILKDQKFGEWVQSSSFRQRLLKQADRDYDFEAADELFNLWKERQEVVQNTAKAEETSRKQAVKSASTGSQRGSGESTKKVYRRADIIKLMKDDPDRYEALQDDIMRAYQEGRVR